MGIGPLATMSVRCLLTDGVVVNEDCPCLRFGVGVGAAEGASDSSSDISWTGMSERSRSAILGFISNRQVAKF